MGLLRRRKRAGTGSPEVPRFAVASLGRAGLRAAFRKTEAIGDRADAWVVEVPGDRAVRVWDELGSNDGAWCSVILGGLDDEARLAEARPYCMTTSAEILAIADGIDVDGLIANWRQADDEPDDEWDIVGEWPDSCVPNSVFALPYDTATGMPRTTVVAIVAVADPSEIPAILGWGEWNACPAPEQHVAMMRRWSERYGAQVMGVSSDVIEMTVASPPRTRDEAMRLAGEQFAYCEDIVTQGTGTISALAATLLDAPVWFFWWD